ncbi:MAG: sugar phosphate nucleotidyltransferase [Candidatus Marinimicrobia bacterium]|nr:sugar phosphate nucleotidyltransferase [Candidatus Neomarinimicrobiota bacterium]MDP6936070.1 sugar phosphate nucleotidyltransferase [Candidatus Neomarinimicrobiota bacterium]
MKAVIPVAGHGTRLEPHTLIQQKCLLPVAGKPVLEHILDRIVAAGITEVTLIIGHLGDQVIDFCSTYPATQFTFVTQKEQLGLGHAIHLGLEDTKEPVLIVLGDSILELDYLQFTLGPASQLGVKSVPDPQRFGIVELEGDRVIRVVEKPEFPPSDLALIGIYYINNQLELKLGIQQLIDSDTRTKNEYQLTDALQIMMDRGHVFNPFEIEACLDCGLPETMLATNKILLKRAGESSIHTSATISDSNLVHSTISEDCTVNKASLENVIMLAGSKVSGKNLQNQIIGFQQEIS